MASAILNAVLFQLVWAACVGGGGAGLWWLGPLAVLAFALWQVPQSDSPRGELLLIAVAALMGFTIDSLLVLAGLLRYPAAGPWGPMVAPIWIVALWIGFALTLNQSLGWLKGRTALAAIFGGIAGPFSYWIGATAWNAVEFAAPTLVVLGALGATWALVTPTLISIAERAITKRASTMRSIDPETTSGVA